MVSAFLQVTVQIVHNTSDTNSLFMSPGPSMLLDLQVVYRALLILTLCHRVLDSSLMSSELDP